MTSKEIANKWQMNRYLTPHQDGGMDNKEFYEQLDDDISNYAKQEAIGFVHWITSEQEWVRDESGNWIERMKHNPKVITTEELYTLYLNQP